MTGQFAHAVDQTWTQKILQKSIVQILKVITLKEYKLNHEFALGYMHTYDRSTVAIMKKFLSLIMAIYAVALFTQVLPNKVYMAEVSFIPSIVATQ